MSSLAWLLDGSPTPVPAASDATDASRSQAQQDSTTATEGDVNTDGKGDVGSLATRVKSSGFVDAGVRVRRRNAPKVVLTRELLESYHHESLDNVTERLGLSKTTIKAACRHLGLARWPYQHKGPQKKRTVVHAHAAKEQEAGGSEHASILKGIFHELLVNNTDTPPSAENVGVKRQRVGEKVTMGVPLTSPLPLTSPGATLAALQAMQLQSLSALSAMVTTLTASDQQLALTSGFPPFLPQPQVGGLPPLNYGHSYGGAMHQGQGAFQQQPFPGHFPQMVSTKA